MPGGRGGPRVEEIFANTLLSSKLPETSFATENDQKSFGSDYGKKYLKA
jgi:hypothetical protein